MITRIYFVRHAEPDHGWKDDRTRPLTPEGRADARVVADFFSAMDVDAVYCSPYERSLNTVRPTAEHHRLAVTIDERLRERRAGPDSNNREMFAKRWSDLHFHEPGGESIHEVQTRNMEAVTGIAGAHQGGTVVVGTHGTALSSILNYYDPGFGIDDFLRIIDFMPYIIRLDFNGQRLEGAREELYVDKSRPRKDTGNTKARS